MGLFDDLENRCEEIADKAGVPAEQVQSMSAMLQQKLGDGSSQADAIEAVAREHGISVDKVQEILSHCGGADALSSEASNIIGGFLKG